MAPLGATQGSPPIDPTGSGRAGRQNVRSTVTQIWPRRHRRGVNAADGEVYRKYAEELTRFATGLVGPGNAADVVSDAVLSCFNSETWSTVTAKRSYLYRGVYNKAAEFHRSSGRRRRREELAAPREMVEVPELRPEVLAAVLALSVRQRAVIVLTYWEDLDPAAIATLLGIAEGSVKRHIARGRSRLKEALNVSD
jgi:RNA polymerase sigma factor (sigma-70 family)